MKCPKCNITLVISERKGIEIDYCPDCRGVWLDRGELDKIIEKTNSEFVSQRTVVENPENNRYHDNDKYNKYGKKRKGLLGELFDF